LTKLLRYRLYLYFFLAVLAVALPVSAETEAFGSFRASLDWPPSRLANFDPPPEKFSVAYGAPIIPDVLRVRIKGPKIVSADFETNSLRCAQEYHRRGTQTWELIPVSVDANAYMEYRMAKNYREDFQKTTGKSYADLRKSGGRTGLGIKVALPKRLDRIFGEGGAGLTVAGFRRITFSGRSQWTEGTSADFQQPSRFPTLNMEQVSRFDITGTIGSKIRVSVSQDSQTDIPLENRIQIRYKGEEDDILRSIEAGNTNLNIRGAQFVGYSSNIRGLFGIKAEAQLGNLNITAIASQEKGSSDRASYSPSGDEAADDVRDVSYASDRMFDLAIPGELDSGDVITNFRAFEEETRDNPESSPFVSTLAADVQDTSLYKEVMAHEIKMLEMEDNLYTVDVWRATGQWYIHFPRQITSRAIGVWMVVERVDGSVDTLGDISSKGVVGDPYLLKLIRPRVPRPTDVTWDMAWRNCYRLPTGVTSSEDIEIKIYKGLVGTERTTSIKDFQEDPSGRSQNYLEILGLDQYNPSSNRKLPDGKLDDRFEIIDPRFGLLIFPSRTPFAESAPFVDDNNQATLILDPQVPDMYDFSSSQELTQSSQYFIRMLTRTRETVINLNRPNIIEGSERITANGELLAKDIDYSINYNFGRVQLKSEKATDPNADLNIEFEYAPFLAVQQKSLFGMRAQYEWSKDFRLGGTFLFKSDKAQERKPRVGQETARMVVYDLDASIKLSPQFITRALDALPFYQTRAASGLTISGEVAQSHPNPNVDGVAYVDDFESALEQLSLRLTRTAWKEASEPVQIKDLGYQKGKLLWHAPLDAVSAEDVYNLEAGQRQGSLQTLKLRFFPKHVIEEKTFNSDSTELIIDTLDDGPLSSWAGISYPLIGGVDADRAQLFEVRLNTLSKKGKLHFDFGRISDDINDNVSNDLEDKNNNNSIDDGEDVGLDGLADPQEPGYHPILNPDPNGDNWYFNGQGKCPLPPAECPPEGDPFWNTEENRFRWINGTEGNSKDLAVLNEPDEEALGVGINYINQYFSFEIDLADDRQFYVDSSEWGPANNPWRTYRIPIKDSLALDTAISDVDNPPRWEDITHVRVWLEDDTDTDEPIEIHVASWYFVQSNWIDSVDIHERHITLPEPMRSKFVVASVGDDDGTFTPPPGVEAYKDPTTGGVETQRGLLLQFTDLNHFDTCLAIKQLLQVDKYSGYGQMEMYVHGGLGIDEDPNGDQQVGVFLRLGQDSANFYEIRRDVHPGWDDRNHLTIDFNELTAFKDSLIRNAEDGKERQIDGSNSQYRVKGAPNLNEVKLFTLGVVNHDVADTVGGATGEIWVDELRVSDVRRDVGTAARVAVNGTLADLLTYSFSYQTQDPYFRNVSSATRGGGENNLGSGKTATTYNYNLNFNLHKFMPRSWGASLPIRYSFSKSTSIPLLRTGSDIVLPDEIRDLEKSVSSNRNLSISENFSSTLKNPLFSLFLNRQSVRISYRRSNSSSVNRPYAFGENLSVNSTFNLAVKKPPTLPIFFWTSWIPIAKKAAGSRLGLYPTRWNLSADYTRNATVDDDINGVRRSSLTRKLSGRMDLSYSLFPNLGLGFTYTTQRDLSDLERVNISFRNLRLGIETSFNQSFSANYDPKLIGWFTTKFDYKANYRETWDRGTESNKGQLSRSMGVSGTFDHMRLLGGKSSGGGGQRRIRGRRNVGRGGQAGKTEEKKKGKPFYDPPLAVLRFLTGWIKSPTYTYSDGFNNLRAGLRKRPHWHHMFGFKDYPEVTDTVQQSVSPKATESQKISGTSGFNVLGGVTVDVRYSRSSARDLITTGTPYEKISTSFPDLTIRITKFKKLPLIKPVVNKIIETFNPRTGFSRTASETIDLEAGRTTTTNNARNHNPLISVSTTLFRRLKISGKYNLSRDEDETFDPTTGDSKRLTRTKRTSMDVTLGYSFTAGSGLGIPLLGKMKFKSTMSIDLTVGTNTQYSEFSAAGDEFTPSTDKSDFQWRSTIRYSFSQQVNGGMTTMWRDSNDRRTGRISHVREVSIFAELRF